MLREAQRRFREGYHPECQWSSGQRGLDRAFASRELGRKAPYKLRRTMATLVYSGLLP